MFRVPRAVSRLNVPLRRQSTLPVPAFGELKFQQENLAEVMTELPAFNFYEMGEMAPHPYKDVSLAHSVLLETPEARPVEGRAEFSKLENGLTVASIDKQGLTAHIGLFVNAGSRWENASNFGVSHMAAIMAYKSTAHLSHLRTVKTLEQLGANATSTCTAGRESVAYQVNVMREFVPFVVPLMIGNVLFPRLLPWEVKAAHSQVATDNAIRKENAAAYVQDLLHSAAYHNNTLGHSTLATERSLSRFTPETIRNYMLEHFAPERMVLCGVNVEHAELGKWAMRSFADYNAIPLSDRASTAAQYTGGSVSVDGVSPYCHLAVGLESAAWGQADSAAAGVLQTVATLRLQAQVLEQNPYVESCVAFNTSYSDSGVAGAYGVCHADHAASMADGICDVLRGTASVGADELATAKAIFKGQMLRDLDEYDNILHDMGQQLLLSGAYGSAAELAQLVDGVTTADVEAMAKRQLGSKPSVAAFGGNHNVPHLSTFEAALH